MRGFEPPTHGTTTRCSNQLSYTLHGLTQAAILSGGAYGVKCWAGYPSGGVESHRGAPPARLVNTSVNEKTGPG